MLGKVFEGQAEDFTEIDHERITPVGWIRRRCQQVQAFPSPLADFFPHALPGERRIDGFERRDRVNRTECNQPAFRFREVAALRHDDQIDRMYRQIGRL